MLFCYIIQYKTKILKDINISRKIRDMVRSQR